MRRASRIADPAPHTAVAWKEKRRKRVYCATRPRKGSALGAIDTALTWSDALRFADTRPGLPRSAIQLAQSARAPKDERATASPRRAGP